MRSLLNYAFLLAQPSRLESMGSGFRGKRANFDVGDLFNALIVLGGVALTIWALSYMATFRERRWARSSPLILFIDLCRAHRLRWSEVWLLWRVAKSQRLADASRLFVEPQRLETTALRPSLRGQSRQLEDIRRRLFVDLTDDIDDEEEAETAPQQPATEPGGIPLDLSSWLMSGAELSPKDP